MTLLFASLLVYRSTSAPVKPTTPPNLSDLLLPIPCSIQCAVTYARRFSSLMSGKPTTATFADSMSLQNILDYSATLSENQRSDALDKVCNNYHSFDKCLNSCDDVVKSDMQKGMEGLNVLCQQKKSEYLQHLPCLVTSRMNMMVECGQQNQQLTKSTKDLTSGLQNFLMQSDGQILGLLKKYCNSADQQIQCVIPSVEKHCGTNASTVVGDILSVSLKSVKQFAERPELSNVLPEECSVLFAKNYTEIYGIVGPIEVVPLNLSSSQPSNTTAFNQYQSEQLAYTAKKTNGAAHDRSIFTFFCLTVFAAITSKFYH